MAKRITVILSDEEYGQFKKAAGLIPLSRWMKEQCIHTMAIRLEKRLVSDLDKYGEQLRKDAFTVTEPTAPKELNEDGRGFRITKAISLTRAEYEASWPRSNATATDPMTGIHVDVVMDSSGYFYQVNDDGKFMRVSQFFLDMWRETDRPVVWLAVEILRSIVKDMQNDPLAVLRVANGIG